MEGIECVISQAMPVHCKKHTFAGGDSSCQAQLALYIEALSLMEMVEPVKSKVMM